MVPHETAISPEPQAAQDLDALVACARAGDRGVLPQLRAFLDDHPEAWQTAGDLARHALDAWIGLIAGADLIARESLGRKVAALESELAGRSASPLETLLVGRVVACWLQVHYSDATVAEAGQASLRQAAFAQQRLDSAHRRYLGAIGALAMVRRLVATGAGSAGATPQDERITGRAASAPMVGPAEPANDGGLDPRRPVPLAVFDPPPRRAAPGVRGGASGLRRLPSAS